MKKYSFLALIALGLAACQKKEMSEMPAEAPAMTESAPMQTETAPAEPMAVSTEAAKN